MSRPVLPESAYEALGLSSDTIDILMNPESEPAIHAAPNLLQSDEDNARPIAPNETSITLYSELLLHVRAVTLFASLRTNYNRETKAKLSADGSCITVSHEGHIATIQLPINVKGGGDAALSLPSQPPSKELTLRLQMEEKEGSGLLGALHGDERKVNIVPWDGASLDQMHNLEVVCKSCGEVIVPKDSVRQWRDLPNENWAEMMDFWHCHKPDEDHLLDHSHDAILGQKGYAAGNRLQAVAGVGFVDLTTFLLHESDCRGAQINAENCSQQKIVVCKHCKHTLGYQDEATEGWRIQKWSMVIMPFSSSNSPAIYSTPKWISARLLYLIENSGVRKFHIHPPSPCLPTQTGSSQTSIPSLLLWVFTPDLFYSSSIPSPRRHDPTRSLKVFYKQQTWQPLKPGDPESTTIEDVYFTEHLFEELISALEESQGLLPPTARQFQGWDVGLLERFDVSDIARLDDKYRKN
ncbi:ubiquitin-conjugating enzyme E2-binding protein [Pyrenochaeta sp. MPI-SDFR-AT-0127]|nr:ubiquitin-conjugating enzyme E2-binding protein [Pyrenochaeta sp. MPI-SDFR-AT-0127]